MDLDKEAAAAAASYQHFIRRHQLQLASIPQTLWPALYSKLTNEILDAGTYFSLNQESSSLRRGYELLVTSMDGIDNHTNLFLVDHSFTFKPTKELQSELSSNLPLIERLEAMMGLSSYHDQDTDDDEPDDAEDLILLLSDAASCSPEVARNTLKTHHWEVVEALSSLEQPEAHDDMHSIQHQIAQQLGGSDGDGGESDHGPRKLEVKERAIRVFNEIWKFAQTYLLVWREDLGVKVKTIWFVADEVGTSISHSETPNSKMVTFIYYPTNNSTESIPHSVFWPILDLENGDIVTRDFVPELLTNGLDRDAYRITLDIYPKDDLSGAKQRLHTEWQKYMSEVGGGRSLKMLATDLIPNKTEITVELSQEVENVLLDFGLLSGAIYQAYESRPAWFPVVYSLESQLHLLVADFFERSKSSKNWWTIRNAIVSDGYAFTTDCVARIARQVDLGGRTVAIEWPHAEMEVYGNNPFNMTFKFVVIESHGKLSIFIDTEDFIVSIANSSSQQHADHPTSEPTPSLVLDSPAIFKKNFDTSRLQQVVDEVREAVSGLVKAVYLDKHVSPDTSACAFFEVQIRAKKCSGVIVEGIKKVSAKDWTKWTSV